MTALGLACLLIAGCGRFGPRAELCVSVAAPPEAWARAFPDLGFDVRFPDTSGQWNSVIVTGSQRQAVIHCAKAGNTPVLAYPIAERAAGYLRPAGGLYPADVRDGGGGQTMELSWRRGAVALVFSRLCERGLDTSMVNSARLSDSLDRHPDPWVLDLGAIVERLIQGTFSAYDIDPLPARSVSLCPGAGDWFSESPFASPSRIEDGQILSLPALSLGMHALFSTQGRRILICVGKGETVVGPPE